MFCKQAVQSFIGSERYLFLAPWLICNGDCACSGRRRGWPARARAGWHVRCWLLTVLGHVLQDLCHANALRLHVPYGIAKVATKLIHYALLRVRPLLGGLLCTTQKL